MQDPLMTPAARIAVAAFALFALTACGPDATPVKQSGLLATPSASPSPDDSPSGSPSPSPADVPTTMPAPTTAVPTVAPQPAGKTATLAPRTTAAAPRRTTQKPPPSAPPKTTLPAGNPGPFVHPGAFCSPEGAIGFTSAGTRMRCTLKAGEDRARWRAA